MGFYIQLPGGDQRAADWLRETHGAIEATAQMWEPGFYDSIVLAWFIFVGLWCVLVITFAVIVTIRHMIWELTGK